MSVAGGIPPLKKKGKENMIDNIEVVVPLHEYNALVERAAIAELLLTQER